MTARPRIRTLALNFGYAESQEMGYFMVSRVGTKGFRTITGCIHRFLTDCTNILISHRGESAKACCAEAYAKQKGKGYCPSCGRPIKGQNPEYVPTLDELAQFVQGLNTDNDQLGYELYTEFEERGWKLGEHRTGDVVTVTSAEYLIKNQHPSICTVYRHTVSNAVAPKSAVKPFVPRRPAT